VNERDLFIAALQIEGAAERSAYLAKACADDPALHLRVEALLKAFVQAGSFLQRPAEEAAATSDVSPAGAAIHCATDEEPGKMIGPYRLLQQIGEGGMGVVYMAEQTQPVQRKVALKLVKSGMDSRQVLARFEAERQALALMDHPNIARCSTPEQLAVGSPQSAVKKHAPVYCRLPTAHCRLTRGGPTSSWSWSRASPSRATVTSTT
jgi:serine/threonine-protein kinase